MRFAVLAFALMWLALLPPLFTAGSCTAEFEAVSQVLEKNRQSLVRPEKAEPLFATLGWSETLITSDSCRQRKPRFLASCGSGPLLYVEAPIQSGVCRVYRDATVKVQLQYSERGYLERLTTDMAPYKTLPLPWGKQIHWAR